MSDDDVETPARTARRPWWGLLAYALAAALCAAPAAIIGADIAAIGQPPPSGTEDLRGLGTMLAAPVLALFVGLAAIAAGIWCRGTGRARRVHLAGLALIALEIAVFAAIERFGG